MNFVVDISLAAAWILPDEASPEGDRLLDGLQGSGVATVPSLFWYAARSLLTTAERRERIDLGRHGGAPHGRGSAPADRRQGDR